MHAFQTIEWLDMRLAAPADWEIVRHSVRPERGRLALVDRRHQRMLLSWVACTSPDLDQAFDDYRSRGREEDPEARFEDFTGPGRWRGLRRRGKRGVLTMTGQYDARLGRWIEMVLDWPDGFDAALERAVLQRFAVTDPAGPARWRAFQINLESPREWRLSKADVRPADVTFTLVRGGDTITVRRAGMTEAWFGGDLESLVRLHVGDVPMQTSERTVGGHAALFAESRERQPRLRSLLVRPQRRRDLAWMCPESHAVFEITTLTRGREPLDPETLRVECCPCESPAPVAPSASPRAIRRAAVGAAKTDDATVAAVELLDAVPLHSRAVRVTQGPAGEKVFHVPLERKWYMGPPLGWIMPFRRERAVSLDPLGMEVWRSCDGQTSIETIVERFAAAHRLPFHESRLAVMEFLRQLTQRGLIAVIGPSTESADADLESGAAPALGGER